MAKKMKPGQKRCPSCGTTVKGPRTKTCPKCGHEFNGKPQKGPASAAAPAVVEKPAKNGGTVMLDQPQVNKSQAVRDYLSAQPDAVPKDVMAALAKQGITVSRVLVSTVKTKLNKTGTGKKPAKKPAAVEAAPAPVVVEKPANGGTITLEQVKKVAQTIDTLGGYHRLTGVLDVIKELGGVKKFKDLAEAMTVPSTDEIPF